MNCEFLIVGQGLAGTLVGHALEQIDRSIVVIDKIMPYSASPVAAGIIHPVSGRRFVKAWNYDSLLPVFLNTYADMGKKLGFNPLEPLEMHLNLSSVKEENDLLSQAQRYGYADQLKVENGEDIVFEYTKFSYSLPAFKLDIQAMVRLFRERWTTQNKYYEEIIDYRHLVQFNNKWHYHDIVADQVVFCEGCQNHFNPWFKHLPIVPNKGQAFLLKKPDGYSLNTVIRHNLLFTEFNKSIWAGATYEWDFNSPCPDSEGWKFLLQKLRDIIKSPLEIHAHLSGVRPAVADRKPIIANHPTFPNLWAINGFGTKGASIGPYIVNEFVGLIQGRIKTNLFAPDRLQKYLT